MIIENKKLHIDQLEERFKKADYFTTKEISEFYLSFDPLVKKTTINWRVYAKSNTFAFIDVFAICFIISSLTGLGLRLYFISINILSLTGLSIYTAAGQVHPYGPFSVIRINFVIERGITC